MIRVIIADSLRLIRGGLSLAIESSLDMQIVKEIKKSESLLGLVADIKADVLITDLMINNEECEIHGLELLRRLRLIRAALPLIIILSEFEPEYALRIMREGGSGCLTLGASPENLIEAVRTVHSGGRYLSEKLESACLKFVTSLEEEPRHLALSLREYEVFIRLAKGYKASQIAHELSVSPKSISSYRKRAVEKLGIDSNSELIRYAIRYGLIRN